jgi:hypothetical protein
MDAVVKAFFSKFYKDIEVSVSLGKLRKITVFVVGQDAALKKNHAALRSIAAAGHEIGNHSFHHEPWLHLYSPEEIEEEIARAEESIADRHRRGLFGAATFDDCVRHYKKAMDQGLLKIMSKMGISVLSSYRGGYNFEALGLSRSLVAEFFPGMPSRISGIGLSGLQRRTPVHGVHRRALRTGAAPDQTAGRPAAVHGHGSDPGLS